MSAGCPTLGPPSAQGSFARSGRYPFCVVASGATSAGVTPPSSLLRAHAPDQIPPADFGFLNTAGLRRLSPIPAGRWSFPVLSPQSLYGCLDPYPAAPLRCSYPFLPQGLRPHLRGNRFGTPENRRNATSTTNFISGLQSFTHVQAPILARPPGCTHRCGTLPTGQPGRIHHAMNMRLPVMNRGIATRLNRAIDAAGLSPAGLWSYRPLPPHRKFQL